LVFFAFFNVLDLNNQKILWLPSIYQFERTGTNLNHPNVYSHQFVIRPYPARDLIFVK
jgi:hypothetical protein